MGKKSKSSEPSVYSTGPTHEFMLTLRNAVNDLGGDDSDLQRVHKDLTLAEKIARVIVHVDQTSPMDITRIIRYAPNPEIRLRALSHLSNAAKCQAFLQAVVYDDTDPRVRLAAAKLITNEMILTEIALRTEDMSVGTMIVGRIRDPKKLSRIALENPTHVTLYEILERIRGTAALTDFVTKCTDRIHALCALEKITNTVELISISEHAALPAVREQAHRRCAGRV